MSQKEEGKLKDNELISHVYGFCMSRWQDVGTSVDEDEIDKAGRVMTKICQIMCKRLGVDIDEKKREEYEFLVDGLQDLQLPILFHRAMEQVDEELGNNKHD